MLSDDVFRTRWQAAVADLRDFAHTLHDVARVQESEGEGYWKIAVRPHVVGACPFELLLGLNQRHDLVLAGEVYEGRETTSLDQLVPLVRAIADGRVRRLVWESRATGQPVAIAMTADIVPPFQELRVLDEAAFHDPQRHVVIDLHFLPYRR